MTVENYTLTKDLVEIGEIQFTDEGFEFVVFDDSLREHLDEIYDEGLLTWDKSNHEGELIEEGMSYFPINLASKEMLLFELSALGFKARKLRRGVLIK